LETISKDIRVNEYTDVEVLVDDAIFAESPRWYADAFWFSDIGGGTVRRISADGQSEVIVSDIPAPSGLGWTKSGDMLVASLATSIIYRVEPDGKAVPFGLVTVLRRSPERLELAIGDRRDDQVFRGVQARGGADCADQWAATRTRCVGFRRWQVDAGEVGVRVSTDGYGGSTAGRPCARE
jgi:hypothetical protein